MDGFTATLTGGRDLRRSLDKLDDAFRGKALLAAVIAGGLPIQNRAKENVHKVTGTLARSIHIGGHPELAGDFRPSEGYADIGGASSSRDEAEIHIGTNVAYGRREELGFIGVDRLGRRYNFTGHPYLRPAFDEKRAEAEREIADALRAILRKVVR